VGWEHKIYLFEGDTTFILARSVVWKDEKTANLGGIITDFGQRVLLVNANVQPAISSYFLLESPAENGFSTLIVRSQHEEAISHTNRHWATCALQKLIY